MGRIPDQSIMHCWGQRSCRGQLGSICLAMPYGHQIWWQEPLTRAYCIAGVEGHVGVSWGQVGVSLLSNPLWPPKFGGKNLNQSVMHCWGLRSYRGQLGSTRGQLLRNNLWPPNLVGRIPDKTKCIAGVNGHEGVSWGQVGSICLKMPYGHQIGGKNPWPECNALLGSKVMI